MDTHTISVVMPNYNDAERIGIALRAICEQDYSPLEVIVVDDGSTDNSVEVVRSFAQRYSNIRLVRNKFNQGTMHSANLGASMAKGRYLYFASSNDMVLQGFFKKSVALLNQYPEGGLCWSDIKEVRANGSVHEHLYRWLPSAGYISPQDLADITHTGHPLCLGGTAAILRRDLFNQNAYISELGPFGDWFSSLVTVFRHGCCYIPEVLTVINSGGDRYSANFRCDSKLYKRACVKLFQLLASPEYEDVVPFFIRSGSLYSIENRGKSPLLILNAFYSIKELNRHSCKLLYHATAGYFLTLKPVGQTLSVLRATSEIIGRILQLLKEISVTIFCSAKNLCDRFYAWSMHHYVKTRTVLRKKLGMAK